MALVAEARERAATHRSATAAVVRLIQVCNQSVVMKLLLMLIRALMWLLLVHKLTELHPHASLLLKL